MDQSDRSKATLIHRVKHIVLLLASLFFLAFGIQVLCLAYQLNDPFAFVMTFFASNLMILISAVLALGFALKLRRSRQPGPQQGQSRPDDDGVSPDDTP